jgi:hypothetical protein
MDGRGAAAKLSGAKSRPYDSRFAAHVLNSFFLSCFIRNVRTHTHTHTERERERRKISGCIQRNVDLREKVERTEMRERKRRPRWPGDGWDEEKLPSSLSLSSLSLLYNTHNGQTI